MEKYCKNNAIEILSNTADIQVVRHKKLDVWQMVFYRSGEFKYGKLSVRVDKPCALMVKKVDSRRPVVHVADPGQTGQPIQIKVRISGSKGGEQTIDFRPSDNPIFAGATQSFTLKY